MRKKIIAGNWKMNNTIEQTRALLNELKSIGLNQEVDTVVCVPFTDLAVAKQMLEGTNIRLGAQNMHWEEKGAYTGEVSPLMLKELGVEFVIIGHSERREYFNETDVTINKKLKAALANAITPIVCVGESLEQREANRHKELVYDQLKKGLDEISKEDITKVIIAYEPIWAIGTGETATSEQAEEMCAYIRDKIAEFYNEAVAEKIRIQYGGSVAPSNIVELMNKESIDGALVGGASLRAIDFSKLINY